MGEGWVFGVRKRVGMGMGWDGSWDGDNGDWMG